MPTFAIGERDFLLDGEPVQIISGTLHYFRVHPDLWADRLRKARLMGLNTVETYVAWNAHSPRRGEFRTGGQLDLTRFLRLAAEEGLRAIVRPGPYICAEWHNGGLPAWLTADPDVRPRSSDPAYLAAVGDYLGRLLPLLVPLQVTRGGPVLAVQVENEYGAFGDDTGYLHALADALRDGGIEVPLFTSDQADDTMLARGGLPGLLRTANFGSRVPERLATLRRHQPDGPLMCMEFWDGWFDRWGGPHHTTPVEESARALDELLSAGASVNLYMFHGGTNAGFTNGANDKGVYEPTVTSYDYDAPLSEWGDPTPKYAAFRDVIARHAKVPAETPEPAPPAPRIHVPVSGSAPLLETLALLGAVERCEDPPTMDDLGHYQGFLLYRTQVAAEGEAVLSVGEVRDRAQVFVDGRAAGVLHRDFHDTTLAVTAPRPGAVLEILVEDQGRVNYGPRIGEAKGLIGPVLLDGEPLTGWQTVRLPLDDLTGVPFGPARALPRAGFHEGAFDLAEAVDLHLDTSGWGKGQVWINGVNLGRYWRRGPQRTLYVPAPVVRPGANRLVVLELESAARNGWDFVPAADLGPVPED
ncbi:beta-galactosidase family protein [Nocardiopsis mangrovi]|uniref:Beta-galactosidase family protein n=1 Tax=Nocardiopsis mangrovi TaxID=1179818 RepID=A0ABV9DZK8_9ACTN